MSIVVGYVTTPEGKAALDRGVVEATLRGLPLVIVHSAKGGEHEDAATAVAVREDLIRLEARLRANGVAVEIEDLVRGKTPAEDLIEVAQRRRAELIIIGLRKRSAVGKLLLGSNAQQILLAADCAVLAVKTAAPSGATSTSPSSTPSTSRGTSRQTRKTAR